MSNTKNNLKTALDTIFKGSLGKNDIKTKSKQLKNNSNSGILGMVIDEIFNNSKEIKQKYASSQDTTKDIDNEREKAAKKANEKMKKEEKEEKEEEKLDDDEIIYQRINKYMEGECNYDPNKHILIGMFDDYCVLYDRKNDVIIDSRNINQKNNGNASKDNAKKASNRTTSNAKKNSVGPADDTKKTSDGTTDNTKKTSDGSTDNAKKEKEIEKEKLIKEALDYFGLNEKSTRRELKTAYHKKALELHPDKHPEKAEEFKICNNHNQILEEYYIPPIEPEVALTIFDKENVNNVEEAAKELYDEISINTNSEYESDNDSTSTYTEVSQVSDEKKREINNKHYGPKISTRSDQNNNIKMIAGQLYDHENALYKTILSNRLDTLIKQSKKNGDKGKKILELAIATKKSLEGHNFQDKFYDPDSIAIKKIVVFNDDYLDVNVFADGHCGFYAFLIGIFGNNNSEDTVEKIKNIHKTNFRDEKLYNNVDLTKLVQSNPESINTSQEIRNNIIPNEKMKDFIIASKIIRIELAYFIHDCLKFWLDNYSIDSDSDIDADITIQAVQANPDVTTSNELFIYFEKINKDNWQNSGFKSPFTDSIIQKIKIGISLVLDSKVNILDAINHEVININISFVEKFTKAFAEAKAPVEEEKYWLNDRTIRLLSILYEVNINVYQEEKKDIIIGNQFNKESISKFVYKLEKDKMENNENKFYNVTSNLLHVNGNHFHSLIKIGDIKN